MKFPKKAAVAASFVLGVAILATSAFADMIIGSGYDGLKEAAKKTYLALDSGDGFTYGDNCTVDAEFSIKDGNDVIMSEHSIAKKDGEKTETVNDSVSLYSGEPYSSYRYADDNMSVTRRDDGAYRVFFYSNDNDERNYYSFDSENIFERDEVKSAEKVLDAFVGNLSSLITAEERDGKTLYTGSIDGAQIPTYANALASFVMKYGILDSIGYNDNKAAIDGDIYMTGADGKAVQNEDGLITSLSAEAYFKATDVNKIEHEYTVSMYLNVYNVGSTVVTVPDYESSEYEVIEETNEMSSASEKNIYMSLYPSDVGEYYRVIVADDDSGKIVGSKTFVIKSVDEDNGTALCEYTEVYNGEKGEEDKTVHYEFEANYGEYEYNYLANFEYTDENGNTKYGLIDRGSEETSFFIYIGNDYIGNDTEGEITTQDVGYTFFRIK